MMIQTNQFSKLLSQAQKLHQSINSQLSQIKVLQQPKVQFSMKLYNNLVNKYKVNFKYESNRAQFANNPEIKPDYKFINQISQQWPSWTINNNQISVQNKIITNYNTNQQSDSRSVSNISQTTQDTHKNQQIKKKKDWIDKILYAQINYVPKPRAYGRYTIIRYRYLTLPKRDVTIFFPEQNFHHVNYIKLNDWSQVKQILHSILCFQQRSKIPAYIVPNKVALLELQKIEETKKYRQIMKTDPMGRKWIVARPMRDDQIGHDTQVLQERTSNKL